mgnify:CR=1 FL=1
MNLKKNEYNTNASDAMLYCVGCVIKKEKRIKRKINIFSIDSYGEFLWVLYLILIFF